MSCDLVFTLLRFFQLERFPPVPAVPQHKHALLPSEPLYRLLESDNSQDESLKRLKIRGDFHHNQQKQPADWAQLVLL